MLLGEDALVLDLVILAFTIFCFRYFYRGVSAALRQTLTRASVAIMSEDKL